jgi:hypothetical protein
LQSISSSIEGIIHQKAAGEQARKNDIYGSLKSLWIRKAEQSGSLTRIAAIESVSSCVRMKS